METVSFQNDIAPLFVQYRGSMLWRLDLTNYEDVRANAALLYTQMNTAQMPPTPYLPFSAEQIGLFQRWIAQGCQQ